MGHDLTGILAGGWARAWDNDLRGAACSAGVVGAGNDLTGLAVGGVGVGAGGSGRGILVSLVGVGAGEALSGIIAGGVTAFAPDMRGLSVSAANGIAVGGRHLPGGSGRWFEPVNERFTGLSVGLVNYSRDLKGVQLGVLNYAGNNPRWARLLPLVNAHL